MNYLLKKQQYREDVAKTRMDVRTTTAGSSLAHWFFVCFLYIVCRYTTFGFVHMSHICHIAYSRSICFHCDRGRGRDGVVSEDDGARRG